jgi:hypothetical protein
MTSQDLVPIVYLLNHNYLTVFSISLPPPVTMNCTIFWEVTPCSPIEIHRYEERSVSIFKVEAYAG